MTRQQRRLELTNLAQTEEGKKLILEQYVDRCLPAGQLPAPDMPLDQVILAILEREYTKAPPLSAPSPAEERISKAVQACLSRCRTSSAPLATLGKFLADLQEDPVWTDRDVASVEAGVRRGLNILNRP